MKSKVSQAQTYGESRLPINNVFFIIFFRVTKEIKVKKGARCIFFYHFVKSNDFNMCTQLRLVSMDICVHTYAIILGVSEKLMR